MLIRLTHAFKREQWLMTSLLPNPCRLIAWEVIDDGRGNSLKLDTNGARRSRDIKFSPCSVVCPVVLMCVPCHVRTAGGRSSPLHTRTCGGIKWPTAVYNSLVLSVSYGCTKKYHCSDDTDIILYALIWSL